MQSESIHYNQLSTELLQEVREPKDVLPTFGDCGVLEFDYLRLLERWLRGARHRIRLGARARRLMGDMAVLGKGEMLILA